MFVLVDGRIVYTPLFSGVFWDQENPLIEDLDRIEVVSGPGGTLWGANAVNGVINIVSRDAHETTGLLASGVGALVFVLAAKAVTLVLPFFYKRAVDLMTAGPVGEVRAQTVKLQTNRAFDFGGVICRRCGRDVCYPGEGYRPDKEQN